MLKRALLASLVTLAAPVLAASLPKTIISKSVTKSMMSEETRESFTKVSADGNDWIAADWAITDTPMGTTRRFTLNKGGVVYSVDLDTMQCTRTDVSSITESVKNPERAVETMKEQLDLKKDGSCEGANLKGVKYKSSFLEMCFYRGFFLLWQKGMGATTRVLEARFNETLPIEKITLPKGVKCTEGPDLSQGIGGLMQQSGETTDRTTEQSGETQNSGMTKEQASKQAEEAMKAFGELFKRE